jgi:hypothetical protein
VWQARAIDISELGNDLNCLTEAPDYDVLLAARTARLAARTRPGVQAVVNPCEARADAGYRGLENQLYRVEIHDPPPATPQGLPPSHDVESFGNATKIGGESEVYPVVINGQFNDYNNVITVEVGPKTDLMAGVVAHVLRVTVANGKTTLDLDVPTSQFNGQSPEVRPVSEGTFKWSRDNGAIVTRVDHRERDPGSTRMELTVHDLGPDDVRGIVGGVWAEIISEDHERRSAPGVIVRVADVRRLDEPVVVVDAAASQLNLVEAMQAPLRLRRWDGIGALKFDPNDDPTLGWIAVESGVEVRFTPQADYRTTDWWHFPARTATSEQSSGDIEWPLDLGTNQPAALPPMGIEHRYTRLGIVEVNSDGNIVDIHDCRNLFPPLTELIHLVYLGGDGQEAVPNGVDLTLEEPLRVGVFNGRWPVVGARVRFKVDTTVGNGILSQHGAFQTEGAPGQEIIVTTDAHGVAACAFTLEDNRARISQRVEAALLDDADQPVVGGPIIFAASLSMAERVAFYRGDCAGLTVEEPQNQQIPVRTVQQALESLAHHFEILYVGGTAQHGTIDDALANPPKPLPKPLTVALDFPCDEPGAYRVYFEIEGFNAGGKNGWFDAAHTVQFIQVPVSDAGNASVQWWLDPQGPPEQYATARLIDVQKNAVASAPLLFTTYLERNSLHYLGGDGQVGTPGVASSLPAPLRVGVRRDGRPVPGASVRFTVTKGDGSVAPAVDTADNKGEASTTFTLDATTAVQEVTAQLLDVDGSDAPIAPVVFTATLLDASHVAYNPGKCVGLQGKTTVQQAIQTIAARRQLLYLGGTGQHTTAQAGFRLDKPIEVTLDALCDGQLFVRFIVEQQGAALRLQQGDPPQPTLDVPISDGLVAAALWQLAPNGPAEQHAAAQLLVGGVPTGPVITFAAHIDSPASGGTGGGCEEVIKPGTALMGRLIDLAQQTTVTGACLCLEPGVHIIEPLSLSYKVLRHLRITSCTPGSLAREGTAGGGTVIQLGQLRISNLDSFTLHGVTFNCPASYKLSPDLEAATLQLLGCDSVTITACSGSNARPDPSLFSLIEIARAARVRVANNHFSSTRFLPQFNNETRADGPALVILDELADVVITDNRIDGVVFFYGKPAFSQQDLDGQAMLNPEIGGLVHAGPGRVELRGNRLRQLGVPDALIRSLLAGQQFFAFSSMQLGDNVIGEIQNIVVARAISVVTEVFERGAESATTAWYWPFKSAPFGHLSISRRLTFTGNQEVGVNPANFRGTALNKTGAANLISLT